MKAELLPSVLDKLRKNTTKINEEIKLLEYTRKYTLKNGNATNTKIFLNEELPEKTIENYK